MKIAIDVNVVPGPSGGTAQLLRSLIKTLGSLDDGGEAYTVIVRSDSLMEWLSPLAANQKFARVPEAPRASLLRRGLSPIARRVRNVLTRPPVWPETPVSGGFYEGLGCDVVHFPTQEFTVCAVPSVYNPHDLLHLHYPQFFTPDVLAWRETIYRAGCRFAQTVVVNSQWVKEDVTRQYGTSPGKLQVIPEAPPTEFAPQTAERDAEKTRARYGLPGAFAFYPSVSWPHKNHLRLLEALAYLRDRRGLVVPLVCSGSRHDASWPQLEQRLAQLALTDQVRFLGFVPQDDLRDLYKLATCMVLPSLFEANSLPIFEAWLEGTPVACSNITALPEQTMDAGLLFDPLDPVAIAGVVERLFTDAALRDDLRAKGRKRLGDFDWGRTARAYRAIYRRAAGRRLSGEDEALLAWDWMRNPRAGP